MLVSLNEIFKTLRQNLGGVLGFFSVREKAVDLCGRGGVRSPRETDVGVRWVTAVSITRVALKFVRAKHWWTFSCLFAKSFNKCHNTHKN